MAKATISSSHKLRALYLNQLGLDYYARWELKKAVALFQAAVRLNETEPEYQRNLARAQLHLERTRAILQALEDERQANQD